LVTSRIKPKNTRICRTPLLVIAKPQNFSGRNMAQPRYTSRNTATAPDTM
jgi:hypothetical protein